MPRKYTPEESRRSFWAKVDRRGHDECWPWLACRDRDGYGIVARRAWGTAFAHRIAWILAYGEIPAGLCACHSCDNPSCVNPTHLWLGTNADNIADRHAKGRDARGDDIWARREPEMHRETMRAWHRAHPDKAARGERSGTAKLSTDDVIAIRASFASGASKAELARVYGVTRAAIYLIVIRRNWAHV